MLKNPSTNRFLMISNDSKSLLKFRGDLLKDLSKAGYEVYALTPQDGNFSTAQKSLRASGITVYPLRLKNTSLNPFGDLKTLWEMYRYVKAINPHILFAYTIKPILYGGIVAKIWGVKNTYGLFSGLGHLYTENDTRTRFIRCFVDRFLKLILRYYSRVIFQNPDDINVFLDKKLIDQQKAFLISGSGVNLAAYPKTPLPKESDVTFVFIGRLLKTKGIVEFIEAIRLLRSRGYQNICSILGGAHTNPAAIPLEQLSQQMKELNIQYLGEQPSSLQAIQAHHVIVLPSYREGTPRALLEALAVGRIILTTDVPGCREVVCGKENGMLVPPKDPEALAEAMINLIENKKYFSQMAEKSYQLAVEKFDVHKVNQSMIQMMKE